MSYDSVVAADSPVAWWKLADGPGSTSAADSSGGAHPLGSVTAVTFGTSGTPAGISPNTCGTFNGTSSDASETGYDGPASGAFSIEIWINCNSLSEGNFATFFSQGNPGSSSHGWILQNDFGSLSFGIGTGAGVVNVSGGSLPATGWVHLVGTCDGTTTGALYVNGASAGTAAVSAFGASGGQGIHAGNEDGSANFFAGLICEAAVYSVALTPTQVSNHYTAGITPAPPPPAGGITVGTTPVQLAGAGAHPAARWSGSLRITNGTTAIYLGGPNVTPSNGFQVAANATWPPAGSLPAPLFPGDQVWACTASSTSTVQAFQTGGS
jgi:hypothetical protein